MTPTSPRSKSTAVYDALRTRILEGRYSPGFRLVLTSLADEFGVSVVPVREAIRQLQSEGLVDYTHNVGAQVSAIDVNEYRDSMTALAVIEGVATALAAPHLSRGEIARARDLNDRMRDLVDGAFSSSAYRELNVRFHDLLVSACPNGRILALHRAEADRVAMIRRSSIDLTATRSTVSIYQHDHILDLIADRAPLDEIERYARRHKLGSINSPFSEATALT